MYNDLMVHWQAYLLADAEVDKLRAKARQLYTEADRLCAEAGQLYTEVDRLRAKAGKLYTEARQLYTEVDKVWTEAVHRLCGSDTTIKWTDTGCIVAGVMEFTYE